MRHWLRFRKPDDFHAHLRQDPMLVSICQETVPYFARVLAMPNIKPEVITAIDVVNYRDKILRTMSGLKPLMTFCITDQTTPAMIKPLRDAGAIAGKYYPAGVTNAGGVTADIKSLYPIFEEMSAQKMVLCLHGEQPGADPMTAEQEFLPTLVQLVRDFPELSKVLEHISTAAAVDAVLSLRNNVGATITAHHPFLTYDDEKPNVLQSPHHYCKPVAKTKDDKLALQKAMLSGSYKFFLGTDSAPHLRQFKENVEKPSPGSYTAPMAIPRVLQFFEENCRLDKFEPFVSEIGANFYGLPLNKEELEMIRKPWTVPYEYHGVVPFMAREKLHWQLCQ